LINIYFCLLYLDKTATVFGTSAGLDLTICLVATGNLYSDSC